ncbi:MAG: PEP-CTERM sorting domain-containing protein [Cephaloticoccus sp.]|nr:PEP-CTERM sorting domain-containing protein [Cephaloticoccus sp.]MCF7761571.1 PEP-CTERM sorting domain-containing protein [Cephaloticoccus sp.]
MTLLSVLGWVCLVSLVRAVVTDPNIAQYGLGKTHGYTQTGPTTVTASSYDFSVFIDATSIGVIAGAKVYGPLSGYLNTHGPQDLTTHSSGAEFKVTGYLNQGSLNTDFPNDNSGNYKLRIDTGTAGGSISGYDYEIQFNLGGDAYPTSIPTLTLDNGTWSSGVYQVSDTGVSTSFGWSFADYNATTDVVLFSIEHGGKDVVRRQFQGSNPGGYTIDPNLLTAGMNYTGRLTFARIVDSPTDVSGVQGVAYYAVETTFNLQAVPEPSTYLLLGLGLGSVLLLLKRQRRA